MATGRQPVRLTRAGQTDGQRGVLAELPRGRGLLRAYEELTDDSAAGSRDRRGVVAR
jgi:hypothetical protein